MFLRHKLIALSSFFKRADSSVDFVLLNLDISATVYLKKCNEIYAYLREKAPGYDFILIET